MAASSSKERQRRYRARRKAGLRMFTIEISEVELAAALESSGLLNPLNADDDEAVQRALNTLIRALPRTHR